MACNARAYRTAIPQSLRCACLAQQAITCKLPACNLSKYGRCNWPNFWPVEASRLASPAQMHVDVRCMLVCAMPGPMQVSGRPERIICARLRLPWRGTALREALGSSARGLPSWRCATGMVTAVPPQLPQPAACRPISAALAQPALLINCHSWLSALENSYQEI